MLRTNPPSPAPAQQSAAVGSIVDARYTLLREIACGGGGVVFEAEHVHTRRVLAVKVLTERNLSNDAARRRLLREAHALASVHHPNVVDVLDAGECTESGPFVALEMLEGRGLDGILASRSQLPLRDTAVIVGETLDALAFAHAKGVIHRDLKPSNIFISKSPLGHEQVKLLDFGIAQLDQADTPDEAKITKHGELLGTLEYMAPEQLLAEANLDLRCDLYAICVTLYECLTGQIPVTGDYTAVVLWALQGKKPERASRYRKDLPEGFDALLERGLSKEREGRFQSADELKLALEALLKRPAGHSTLLAGKGAELRREVEAPPNAPTVATAMPRRYPRAPYITPVRMVRGVGAAIDGRSEDLSEGGLLVLADSGCDEAEVVHVRFALPISGVIVTVKAQTRWIRNARHARATGLEFIDLAPDAREAIVRYVSLMSTQKP